MQTEPPSHGSKRKIVIAIAGASLLLLGLPSVVTAGPTPAVPNGLIQEQPRILDDEENLGDDVFFVVGLVLWAAFTAVGVTEKTVEGISHPSEMPPELEIPRP